MNRGLAALGLCLLLTISTAIPASGVAELADIYQGPDPQTAHVTEIDCSATPNVTHEFFKDGRTHYTIPGQCRVKKSIGQAVTVRYHVDGNWTPGTKGFATEIGRIYDLGNVAPDLFQPGPPGTYTTFIVRLFCESDPWLNDARCGLEYASGVDELAKLVSRFSRGPFPLTKGAIPVSQRAALLTEYKRATGQFVGPPISDAITLKKPYVFPVTQPPRPNPPAYGATYKFNPISGLNRGQTITVGVQVTNAGSLIWTPANPNPFRLSYHWFQGTTEVISNQLRTNLAGPVGFNQSAALNAKLQAPSKAGTYTLKWDMIQEGITWFRDKGVGTGVQTVVVK